METSCIEGSGPNRGRSLPPAPAGGRRRLTLFAGAMLTGLVLFFSAAPSASALSYGMMWTGDYNQAVSEMEVVQRSGATIFRLPLDKTLSSGGNWSFYDPIFEEAWKRGITIMPYFVRGNVEGTRFLTSADSEWALWWSWVKEAVERYGHYGTFWNGKANPKAVGAWEIWNEPNLAKNNPVASESYCKNIGQTFKPEVNTCVQPEKYGSFLVWTAAAVQAGSKAKAGFETGVLFGGLYVSLGGQAYTSYLPSVYNVAGVSASYQALSLHPYAFDPNHTNGDKTIWEVQATVNGVRNTLDGLPGGSSRSIWITELGWPLAGDPLHPAVKNQAEQARLLSESFSWIKSVAGAKKIDALFWYNLRDISAGTWDYSCGLRDLNGNYRPAWGAFQAQTGAPAWPPPGAQTTSPSSIQETQATLNGLVTAGGYSTFHHFQYKTKTTSAYETAAPLPSGSLETSATTPVNTVTRVQPGTTYHYRVSATSAAGTSYGEDKTFTVPGSRYMRGLSTGSGVSSWAASVSQGLPPESVVADFDGDGDGDVINAEYQVHTSYRYRVGLSNGTGISSWITVASDKGLPAAMDAGDFNADGKADIIVVEDEGNGKYRYAVGISNGSGISSWNVVMTGMSLPSRMNGADFNGDGKADIVVAEPEGNGNYRYAVGISTGSGISSWTVLITGMSYPSHMSAADFSGDGKADIVVAEPEGNGNYRYAVGTSTGTDITWKVVMTGMSNPLEMGVGRFNSDSKADLVVAEYEGNGKYRYGVGISSGTGVSSWTVVKSEMSKPAEMSIGDFNADAKVDVVSIETRDNGAQDYRLGTSNGTGIGSWTSIQTWMTGPTKSDAGDFNADGKADIVSAEPDGFGKYRYVVGISSGSSSVSQWIAVMGSGMTDPYRMSAGDFNGDGKADLMVAEPDGSGKYRYAVGISNGSGIASWNLVMGSGMSEPYRMDAADFNKDGKADIIVAESEGNGKYRYAVGISNGTGIASWSVVMTGMSVPSRMSAADFNADGRADLMVAEPEDKDKPGEPYRYAVGISNGSGIASWSVVMTKMSYPSQMSAADFNADGKADIIVAEPEGGSTYRYAVGISNGSGIASWSVVKTSMSQPSLFSAGDVDGDGKADLLAVEPYS